jgi:hypothetical protein
MCPENPSIQREISAILMGGEDFTARLPTRLCDWGSASVIDEMIGWTRVWLMIGAVGPWHAAISFNEIR